MSNLRYSRLDPSSGGRPGSNLNPTSTPGTPLTFSNTIPEDSRPEARHQESSGSQDSLGKNAYPGSRPNYPGEDFTYQGFIGQPEATKPKRRRTGSSVISTAWTATKQFAVSNFNVPSVGAPWEHELTEKDGLSGAPSSDTVRYFNHQRQRKRLFVNTTFQFGLTTLFAACLVGTLYGFSTMIYGLSPINKRVFNALITGFSLCLGLNMVSSFVGYAQMMRWRFLASGYRTLQDFELVMNCSALSKTFRLIWVGRNRGSMIPSKTQVLAVFWITFNVAIQVFIAMIGLTYSIDVSEEWVQSQYGNVSVAMLNFISNVESDAQFEGDPDSFENYIAQSAVANTYGITGQDYFVVETNILDETGGVSRVYTDPAHEAYWYRFLDSSPNANNPLSAVSSRYVNSTASCESFPVIAGGRSGFDDAGFYTTWVDGAGVNQTWWISDVASGCTTWMTNMTVGSCGPRCGQIYAIQSGSTDDVPDPRFWVCNNTVSDIAHADLYENPEYYVMPDPQAFIMAGAIGTNGLFVDDDSDPAFDCQAVLYPADSQWSPSADISPRGMAELVEKFTVGAFAALDQNGFRYNTSGWYPVPAQVVNVQWKYAGAILAGMPFLQACIWLLVIALANKAIIKDTSHLSTARLLRPIVDKLGNNGCLLTGDEIAEKLGNYRVIYGVRNPGDPGMTNTNGSSMGVVGLNEVDDGAVRHLDVIEENEGMGYRRGRMQEGRYDGMFPSVRSGVISSARADEQTALLDDFDEHCGVEDESEALRRLSGLQPRPRPRRARRMSL